MEQGARGERMYLESRRKISKSLFVSGYMMGDQEMKRVRQG
jgi:hypothetical protein